jgi:hypothetical protein
VRELCLSGGNDALAKEVSASPQLPNNLLAPSVLLTRGELTESIGRYLAVGSWKVHRAVMAEV